DALGIVETRLASDAPDYAPFYERLKDSMPDVYETILVGFGKDYVRAGKAASPEDYLERATAELKRARGKYAAGAPLAALDAVFAAQAAIASATGQDQAKFCGDFLFGSGGGAPFRAFAAGARPLVGRLASADLAAIVEGAQAKPVERPTPADFVAFDSALGAKGLGRDDVALLLDGKAPATPFDDARRCADGRAYLAALAGLPDDGRRRLEAFTLAAAPR
ncbi:MAG: hypothetical protein KGI57_00645, partial [Hyphomicrobiales bacterium]|nr:hypothetical protein [Hyphomicrobiales bacterium]